MNSINLIGRLTANPELKYSKTGKPFCNFSIAVNYNKDETDFINCSTFDIIAENVAKYTSKGRNLGVSGTLRQGKYVKDNKEYKYHYVLVAKITLLDKAEENNKDDLPFN